MQTFRLLAMIVSLGLLWAISTSAAQEAAPEKSGAPRGVEIIAAPSTEDHAAARLKYGRKLAVVVGINYGPKRREDWGAVAPLNNAERDAQAVVDLLKGGYGFEVVPLKGEKATKEAIENAVLAWTKKGPAGVKANECVLFYFAGHGEAKSKGSSYAKTYLWPFDARMEAASTTQATLDSAIDASRLVEDLAAHCPARHKLFVLDCCHSAGIQFHDQNLSGAANDVQHATPLSPFEEPAFQAIVACGSDKKVSDGPGDHSPFTAALLRELNSAGRSSTTKSFTATNLFSRLGQPGSLPEGVGPLCRRSPALNGEFHFFPAPAVGFAWGKQMLDAGQERRLLLSMAPSAFGNWWADEALWFIPSVRQEVLKNAPMFRSAEEEITLAELKKAALSAVDERDSSRTGQNQDYRLRHMKRLMAAESDLKRQEEAQAIAEELGMLPEPQATDRHTRAVLLVKSGRKENLAKAKQAFEDALKAYREADLTPLLALCHVDFGLFLQGANDLESSESRFFDAAMHFQTARRMYGALAPAQFQVVVLWQEATAWRNHGYVALAEARMKAALAAAASYDPQQTKLLTAAAWKWSAWQHMVLWDFAQAAAAFETALEILKKHDLKTRPEALVDVFHAQHGLAMIDRYRGSPQRAVAAYRLLTLAISKQLRAEAAGELAHDIVAHAQLRPLLQERLVNSLERQGDCSLFAEPCDPREAADDYRRALAACGDLPLEAQAAARAKLLAKRAIAVAMPGRGPRADGGRDVELAQELLSKVQALRSIPTPSDKKRKTGLESPIKLHIAIAEFLIEEGRSGECLDCRLNGLRDAIVAHRGQFRGVVQRDDLEALMFAGRLLVEAEVARFRGAPSSAARLQVEEDADRLSGFCRLTRIVERADAAHLKFLRPYYDSAFLARIATKPKHVRELIEIAWDATQPSAYEKSAAGQEACFVVYVASGRCHGLLHVPGPGGESSVFDLSACGDVAGLCVACDVDKKGLPPLPLADDARTALRRAPKLAWRWHDPVLRIGYAPDDARSGYKDSARLPLQPLPHASFPFSLAHVVSLGDKERPKEAFPPFAPTESVPEGDGQGSTKRE